MKITVLIENRVSRQGLKAEHGLSFLIESGDKMVLFDTGASKQFARNALFLGYDLAKVDALILSHGHNDHTGGLAQFIEENNHAPVYLKKEATQAKFKNQRNIGMDSKINIHQSRFTWVNEITEPIPNVYIIPFIYNYFPKDQHFNQFFTSSHGEELFADLFLDELFLVLKSNDEITILSSCSHNGISNIVETARRYFKLPVNTIMGGFHLKDEPDSNVLPLANYFNKINPKAVYTGHCTGIEKYANFKINTSIPFFYFETGDRLEI